MKRLPIALALVCIFSCFAHPVDNDNSNQLPPLRIVELVAKGSTMASEFNIKSDWLKLENYGDDTIRLSDYHIFITDDVDRLRKFRLKEKTIAPNSSIIIWCDDKDITRDQIHTNFKLSSQGETVSVTMKRGSRTEIIDQVYYEEDSFAKRKRLLRAESDLLVYDRGF